jgi:hypothetical protein
VNRSKHTTIISKQTIRDIKKAARESFGVKRAAYQMSTAPTTAEADDYVPDVREWHASAYSGCRDVVQLTDLEGKEVADGCILDVYVDEPGADGEHLGCVPIRLDLHWDRGTCYVRASEADAYPDPDPVLPEDRVAPDDPETEPEEDDYEERSTPQPPTPSDDAMRAEIRGGMEAYQRLAVLLQQIQSLDAYNKAHGNTALSLLDEAISEAYRTHREEVDLGEGYRASRTTARLDVLLALRAVL